MGGTALGAKPQPLLIFTTYVVVIASYGSQVIAGYIQLLMHLMQMMSVEIMYYLDLKKVLYN